MIQLTGIRFEDAQQILANARQLDPSAMNYEGGRTVNGSVVYVRTRHNPEHAEGKIASYAWTWDVEIRSSYYVDSTLEDLIPGDLKEFVA